MAERKYRTIDKDAMDLIAFREYGISQQMTENLLDENYRIADKPILMPAGVEVELVDQAPPQLQDVIKLWD